jgi:hypothetical protein
MSNMKLMLAGFLLMPTACGSADSIQPCDIRLDTCQQEVFFGVTRLRGDGFDPFHGLPPIRTISRDAFRRELQDEAAAAKNAAPGIDAYEVTLQLFGLLTPAMAVTRAVIDNQVENVAAFYDPSVKKVTIVEQERPGEEFEHTLVLAHELVHAFQDREGAFAERRRTSDGWFARRSFTEGEASLYENLAAAEMAKRHAEDVDWHELASDYLKDVRATVAETDSPLLATRWLIYPIGVDYCMNAWLEGGNAAIRRLSDEHPQRSVDFMEHFHGYDAPPSSPLACRVGPPNSHYEVYGSDALGATGLYAFLVGRGSKEGNAWSISHRWLADSMWVYLDERSKHVAASWRIRLTSQANADAVLASLGDDSAIQGRREGREVVLNVSDDAKALGTWPGVDDCN